MVVREALIGCTLSEVTLRRAVEGGGGSEDCMAEYACLLCFQTGCSLSKLSMFPLKMRYFKFPPHPRKFLTGATLVVVREALIGCTLSEAALRKAVEDGGGSEDCMAEQTVLNAVVTLLDDNSFG